METIAGQGLHLNSMTANVSPAGGAVFAVVPEEEAIQTMPAKHKSAYIRTYRIAVDVKGKRGRERKTGLVERASEITTRGINSCQPRSPVPFVNKRQRGTSTALLPNNNASATVLRRALVHYRAVSTT